MALVLQPRFQSAIGVAAIATLGALLYAFAMMLLRRLGAGESGEAVVLHFSLVALVDHGGAVDPGVAHPVAAGRAVPARHRRWPAGAHNWR